MKACKIKIFNSIQFKSLMFQSLIFMMIKIHQEFFIFNTRELLVNIKDLPASTLVGITQENPELDPLCVQHFDNRLCASKTLNFKVSSLKKMKQMF